MAALVPIAVSPIMHAIAFLLEKYRLSCQKILIDFGLQLGLVENINAKAADMPVENASYALLDSRNEDPKLSLYLRGNEALYDDMVAAFTAVQVELEQDLQPLLEKQFEQLSTLQPNLWLQLKNNYLLRLHADVLVQSARAKSQLLMTLLQQSSDPREISAISPEQKSALLQLQTEEQQTIRDLEQQIAAARKALVKELHGFKAFNKKKSLSMEEKKENLELLERNVVAAEKSLKAELDRIKTLKLVTASKNLEQEIEDFWLVQNFISPERDQFSSDGACISAVNSQKKAYLVENIATLDFNQFPLLTLYFTNKKNQHSQLSKFLLSEFVEPQDLNSLSTSGSATDKSLEDTLLDARENFLVPEVHYQLAKLWVVVKEMALNIKLLSIAKAELYKDYFNFEATSILENNTVLHARLLKTLTTIVVFGWNNLARVHSVPWQLHIEKPKSNQRDRNYWQDLPKDLTTALEGTPIKVVKQGDVIFIDYQVDEFFYQPFKDDTNNMQARLVTADDRRDYRLVLKLKADRSGVESFDLRFDSIKALPLSLQQYLQTPVQQVFLAAKMPDNGVLKQSIRAQLQTLEKSILLKQLLCILSESCCMLTKEQARRIVLIIHGEVKQRLENKASTDDPAMVEELAVMLLASRQYLEKTAKWYQRVPSKANTLALIDKKIPVFQTRSVRDNSELGHFLIQECDLIKRHRDFFEQSFVKAKGLTSKAFEHVCANQVKELAAKDLSTRLSAQYSLSRLLSDTRTVTIAAKSIMVKEAVVQQLLTGHLGSMANLHVLLIENLVHNCQDGQLTADGEWLLNALLKHDRQFKLFDETLKDVSPTVMNAIKKAIAHSGLNIKDEATMVASCTALVSLRRDYLRMNRMKKCAPTNRDVDFDYLPIMSMISAQFIPVLIMKAKDPFVYQAFMASVPDESREEYVTCIDNHITAISATIEDFLNFIKPTASQSSAQKLQELTGLCDFNDELQARLAIRIQSMFVSVLHAPLAILANPAVKSFITYLFENKLVAEALIYSEIGAVINRESVLKPLSPRLSALQQVCYLNPNLKNAFAFCYSSERDRRTMNEHRVACERRNVNDVQNNATVVPPPRGPRVGVSLPPVPQQPLLAIAFPSGIEERKPPKSPVEPHVVSVSPPVTCASEFYGSLGDLTRWRCSRLSSVSSSCSESSPLGDEYDSTCLY